MQTEWGLFQRANHPLVLVGLILVLTTCLGCAQTGKAIESLRHKLNFGEDTALLEKGFESYLNGNSKNAVEIFNKLYSKSGSLSVRRKALYGLSICRLAAAGTPEEFDEALLLWQEWRQMRVTDSQCEDPVYLEPFLMCKFPKDIATDGAPSIGGVCTEKVSRYQYETAQEKNIFLEKNIKALEEKINALEVENDALVRNQVDKDGIIKTLKEKIRALEDIDQKIQEKKNKTEISSPE